MFKPLLVIPLTLCTALAHAAPSALVEDVSPSVSVVQPFDFVEPGDTIDLGSTGELALGYLDSCTRETIIGGQVTIGSAQSEVTGGQSIDRIVEECNGTQLALAANESSQSGASAFRAIGESAEPELTLGYQSPVILFSGGGKVSIKRTDAKEDRVRFKLEKADKRFAIDLAKESIALTPGGIYMVSAGGNSLLFKVAKTAVPGDQNYLGRLLIP